MKELTQQPTSEELNAYIENLKKESEQVVQLKRILKSEGLANLPEMDTKQLMECIAKHQEEFGFDKELVTLVKFIRRRLRKDNDVIIAITGHEGSSKSTLAVWLGYLVDRKFDMKKNISFFPNPSRVQREFNSIRKYGCFIIDEAVRVMLNQDWASGLSKSLMKMYATERYQNKFTILCIPSFEKLNSYFRDFRVLVRIHCYERGYAMYYIRDEDKDNRSDTWHTDYAQKLKKKYTKGQSQLVGKKLYKLERKLPNYVGEFHFDDLPKEIRDRYKALKYQSRIESLALDEEAETVTSKMVKQREDMVVGVLKLLGNKIKDYTLKDMAAICKCSKTTISRFIKRAKHEQLNSAAISKAELLDAEMRGMGIDFNKKGD